MQTKYLCPFCNTPLTEFIPNSGFSCNKDGLLIDFTNRRAHLTERAPLHLLESQAFLQEFKKTDPIYVFSPAPLFSSEFSLVNCDFIGCKSKSSNVNCISVDKLNVKTSVIDKHLIAGNKMVADNIINLFYHGLKFSSDSNPLVLNEFPDYDKFLWIKFLMENNNKEYKELNGYTVTLAYFQPTLEGMINILDHKFEGVPLPTLTDEQALYSYLLMQPQINIRWGTGFYGMTKELYRFISAVLKDVDKLEVKEVDPVKKLPIFLTAVPKWYDELKLAYYQSMPSTAVNVKGTTYSTFDILNHEFSDHFLLNKNSTNKDLLMIMRTYSLQHELWCKYAEYSANFGVDTKLKYLVQNGSSRSVHDAVELPSTSDEIVLEFWKKMCCEYTKEITELCEEYESL